MLPRPENRVTLDPKRRDAWGIPVLHIDCRYGQAELVRAREQAVGVAGACRGGWRDADAD